MRSWDNLLHIAVTACIFNEISGRKSERFYGCCKEPYPDITSAVVMARSTLYYGLNLLIPCVLISRLASLVFLVPADSGEKISLGITVLLSLTVFMLLMAEIMPATSDSVPLIAEYFATTMVIVGLSVTATVPTTMTQMEARWQNDLCGPAELVCLVPAYEASREARVRPACPNKTTCSSPSSVDLNASSSSSHLATSNPLSIGFRGLETMPLSTTTTPPDSGDRHRLMASLFTLLCTLDLLMPAPNFVEAISKEFFN
ncbi:unnamed protein product [Boreogadus saida]